MFFVSRDHILDVSTYFLKLILHFLNINNALIYILYINFLLPLIIFQVAKY